VNPSKICILGGTGFVGRHLTRTLADQGHRVRVLTTNPERHRDLLVLPRVELVEANVHAPQVLARQLEGQDVAVNLVGILNERGFDGSGFHHVHVELTRKLVHACQDTGVSRLLHMSALHADAAHGPSHYLRTKGEAEALAHAAGSGYFHVTSFRPSVIFGPDDSFINRFAALLRVTPLFFPLACPNSRFAPVYVGDVVAAFIHSLDDRASAGRRYDLCGPQEYTLKQLVEATAEWSGLQHRSIIGLNDTLSRLQARVFQLLPGKPLSMDNYRSLQIDSVCEHNDLPALGINPTAIEAVMPAWLASGKARDRYDRFRRGAHRH